MTQDREFSLVFEYEPENVLIKILRYCVVILIACVSFYAGYMYCLAVKKPELEEREKLKKRLPVLEEDLKKANSLVNSLREENKLLSSGKEKIIEVKNGLARRIETLEKQVATMNELKEKNEMLSKQIEAAVALKEKHEKQLQEYSDTIAKLEEIRKKNVEGMEELNQEIKDQIKKVESLEQANKEISIEKEKTLRKMIYYKKNYEKIVAKYDEIRDKHLEEHPQQNAINWMESQIFTSPRGDYKILFEITKDENRYINLEVGVYSYSRRRSSPKFTIFFYDKNGKKINRVIRIDESKTGINPGRIIFHNQGWKAGRREMPTYFEIKFH